jgi:hypothetical protein
MRRREFISVAAATSGLAVWGVSAAAAQNVPMDGLTFISRVIGSLAWPVAVVFLVMLLR